MLNTIIRFFLENKLVTIILLVLIIGWGTISAPFDWATGWLPHDPVPVDAIPDIGENQQIVFTSWPGRSPQDIEDQITYPLTTSLLGVPGVKTIRSSSMFGFSSIYIIFNEDIEFYWSRSRILEKLNSLSLGVLPEGVQPALGPDATALGQIFWYTLEGRDTTGMVTGGWDLQELRSVQDFYVKYALASAEGVAEVASIGGFVKEYQVDVDPNAMKAHNVGMDQVINAVRNSNLDVGAKTIEINNAEYLLRGLGYVKSLEDLEEAVVAVNQNVPIRIRDIGRVSIGPATRRGVLDKGGAEVVGGVVVARHGANPLEVINNVKAKIEEIAPGLPAKTLSNGDVSQLTVVPFYDRTQLIQETIGTLEEALTLEVLITIIVVMVMVMNLPASLLISSLLPLAVLMTFIAMRYFGVDANIVALSGIAIAIGTMVDLGIILSENMLKHLQDANPGESKLEVIYRATSEVSGAVVTAVATTVVSFIPVFMMEAAEGKLFRPLAFTKTFALIASVIVALVIIPPLAHWLFGLRIHEKKVKVAANTLLLVFGFIVTIFFWNWAGWVLMLYGAFNLLEAYHERFHLPNDLKRWYPYLRTVIAVITMGYLLTRQWMPLGVDQSLWVNFIFVGLMIGFILGLFALVHYYYVPLLRWCLRHKLLFLTFPMLILVIGITIWMGFNRIFGFISKGFDLVGWNARTTGIWSSLANTFPGTGEEFMPSLDEGSFLLMPSSMPHAGMEENKRVIQALDMSVNNIPEVDMVVGKMGRAESALDPAPISMYENIINYKSEYKTDVQGRRLRFATNENGEFLRDDNNELIPDENGRYYRQWRAHIHSPDDIWDEIVQATHIPGVTSAPKLQPIETRLVMLQTGMRAPMGIKVKGPDLHTIEQFAMQLEHLLKEVPSVKAEAAFADRIVGKPYLQLKLQRPAIARYGLTIRDVQNYIETAIGGMKLTTTVEGRERYPIRVRYPRELRDDPENIRNMLIPTPTGMQIPLGELVTIEYIRGPQMIKSEDTFLVGYVLFDKRDGYAEVEVVEAAQAYIQSKIDEGSLIVPAGINFRFAGSYENQVRAEQRLSIIVPLVFLIIFLILYFQFRSVLTALMVFSGVGVAFAGGFLMIWLYNQGWFFNFDIFGTNMQDLFQMKTINLSVAVWVGFIALFGIATDDGVVMATYLQQSFHSQKTTTVSEIRNAVVEAGSRRIRPCLMTTATTILALLPVLTSTGRGSDIMIPMAIPAFGGMTIEIITLFVVPVLYSGWKEGKMIRSQKSLNEKVA